MSTPSTSPKKTPEIQPWIDGIARGDKTSVAGFFNLLEDRRPEPSRLADACLDELWRRSLERSHVLGITGPPGVGKSTLISRLIRAVRKSGRTLGILAVDPSSPSGGGALLGDRVRFDYDPSDPGVFARSMANRGEYGGVADRAFAAGVVLRSAFDLAVVETVGVGQAETDVAGLVDTLMLVVQPGSGDTLQFIKAGIMEQPHALIVNKADRPEAHRTALELEAALRHGEPASGSPRPRVLRASALEGDGIDEILAAARERAERLQTGGALADRRRRQAADWVEQSLLRWIGTLGLQRLREAGRLEEIRARAETAPFAVLRDRIGEQTS